MGLTIIVMIYNPISDQYVSYLKAESVIVGKQGDLLYEEIEKKSKQYQIPASDARIDPVWKAIPGYNGLEVDVEASYHKMKNKGVFNEDKLDLQRDSSKGALKGSARRSHLPGKSG